MSMKKFMEPVYAVFRIFVTKNAHHAYRGVCIDAFGTNVKPPFAIFLHTKRKQESPGSLRGLLMGSLIRMRNDQAPVTLEISTFTPGPMDDEIAMRSM